MLLALSLNDPLTIDCAQMRTEAWSQKRLCAIALLLICTVLNASRTLPMSVHPTPPGYPRYLTTAEAAAYLRLSRRTLEKHRCIGTGPRFRKLGRMIRYTIPDLDKWASARLYEMTSEPGEMPSRRREEDID